MSKKEKTTGPNTIVGGQYASPGEVTKVGGGEENEERRYGDERADRC